MNWEVNIMASKTSFFNPTIYKKNMTRYLAFPIIYFVFLMIAIPGVCVVGRIRANTYPGVYDYMLEHHSDFANAIMRQCVPLYVAIYMILVTLAVFSYLYQSRSANMMHAFPVDRRTLFFTGICSILTMVLVPQLLVAIITTIIAAGYGAASVIWIVWYWFLCMSGYALCFLGIAVFTAMVSGQLVTNFIFYWIFNLMFLAGEFVIRSLLSFLCFGMNGCDTGQTTLLCLTPIAYLQNHTDLKVNEATYSVYHITGSALLTLLVYALVGVALTALAYLFYRRKQMETAGDFITIPFFKPVFTIGMSFFLSVLLATITGYACIDILPADANAVFLITLFLCIVFYGIVYFIAQMLIDRTTRVFSKKHWVTCGAYSLIVVFFLLLVRFDVFGMEAKVPEAPQVAAVRVNLMSANYVLTDQQDIEVVTDIHEKIVDSRPTMRPFQYHTTEPYVPLSMTYYLKDGTTIERYYRLCSYENREDTYQLLCQDLVALLNDPELIKQHLISPNYEEITLTDCEITRYVTLEEAEETDEESTEQSLASYDELDPPTSFTQEQLSALYAAFLQDIDEGNYKVVSLNGNDTFYTNELHFGFTSPTPVVRDDGQYRGHISTNRLTDYYNGALTNMNETELFTEISWDLYLYLTPDCEHTVATLIDMGAIDSVDELQTSTNRQIFMYTD